MDMKAGHTRNVCSICVVLWFDLCNAAFVKRANGKVYRRKKQQHVLNY